MSFGAAGDVQDRESREAWSEDVRSPRGITLACPAELRWSILQAALAGDRPRWEQLMSEAAGIERRAHASRVAHAADVSAEDRLFR